MELFWVLHIERERIPKIPAEQAAQRQESGDAFPEDSKAPHAPVNWKRGDLIGAGAFGRVYLGMNNDNGELIAIKQVIGVEVLYAALIFQSQTAHNQSWLLILDLFQTC